MVCPVCGTRRARRGCPALGQQICAFCCGTKRLVEIRCPNDCVYLTTAREHPPAATVRQHQRDMDLLLQSLRDLNDRQAQLFVMINACIQGYEQPELQPLLDDDVADAATALAGTYETATRGVIYEHRPAALPADRLATALKPMIAEAGKNAGSSFDRDAAVVLRRIGEAVRATRAAYPANRRAYLELLTRVLQKESKEAGASSEAQRLIVP